jgi:hypothetical protein
MAARIRRGKDASALSPAIYGGKIAMKILYLPFKKKTHTHTQPTGIFRIAS